MLICIVRDCPIKSIEQRWVHGILCNTQSANITKRTQCKSEIRDEFVDDFLRFYASIPLSQDVAT